MFWELTIPEYRAAMDGIVAIETAKTEAITSRSSSRPLNKNEIAGLKDRIAKRKTKKAVQ